MHRARRRNRRAIETTAAACFAFLGMLASFEICTAQETLPPIPIEPRTTVRWHEHGQFFWIATGALSATIYFDEISAVCVAGFAVRTSGGTTSGVVTVRWETRNQQVILQLDPRTPLAHFEMHAEPSRRQPPAPALD